MTDFSSSPPPPPPPPTFDERLKTLVEEWVTQATALEYMYVPILSSLCIYLIRRGCRPSIDEFQHVFEDEIVGFFSDATPSVQKRKTPPLDDAEEDAVDALGGARVLLRKPLSTLVEEFKDQFRYASPSCVLFGF